MPTDSTMEKASCSGDSTSDKDKADVSYPLKEYNQVPIYVVEYHNEALPHIFKSVGGKYLPIRGNTVIHLDSHPDLGIPSGMPARLCYDKHQLFDLLSIENWILPGAYAEIFKNIVWIKPPWSNQMPEGQHLVKVGEDKVTGEIKVSSALQYFVGEAVYEQEKNLNSVKDLNVEVLTLNDQLVQSPGISQLSSKLHRYVKKGAKFILDIDLDFFSTKNPFLDLYPKANTYNHLRNLYTFDWSRLSASPDADTLTRLTEDRIKQLQQLKGVFRFLEENLTLDEVPEELRCLPCYPGVESLYEELQSHYPDTEIEWMIVHDGGCTIDEHELPHHVTKRPQLDQYLNEIFPKFLDELPGYPTIVTISRSTVDDYCPREDVDYIQDSVLNTLKEKFQNVNVILDYSEDEENDCPVLIDQSLLTVS